MQAQLWWVGHVVRHCRKRSLTQEGAEVLSTIVTPEARIITALNGHQQDRPKLQSQVNGRCRKVHWGRSVLPKLCKESSLQALGCQVWPRTMASSDRCSRKKVLKLCRQSSPQQQESFWRFMSASKTDPNFKAKLIATTRKLIEADPFFPNFARNPLFRHLDAKPDQEPWQALTAATQPLIHLSGETSNKYANMF